MYGWSWQTDETKLPFGINEVVWIELNSVFTYKMPTLHLHICRMTSQQPLISCQSASGEVNNGTIFKKLLLSKHFSLFSPWGRSFIITLTESLIWSCCSELIWVISGKLWYCSSGSVYASSLLSDEAFVWHHRGGCSVQHWNSGMLEQDGPVCFLFLCSPLSLSLYPEPCVALLTLSTKPSSCLSGRLERRCRGQGVVRGISVIVKLKHW